MSSSCRLSPGLVKGMPASTASPGPSTTSGIVKSPSPHIHDVDSPARRSTRTGGAGQDSTLDSTHHSRGYHARAADSDERGQSVPNGSVSSRGRNSRQTLVGEDFHFRFYVDRSEVPEGGPLIPQALFRTKCTNCGSEVLIRENSWICERCGKWEDYSGWNTPDT